MYSLENLIALGKHLDFRPYDLLRRRQSGALLKKNFLAPSVRDWLIAHLLKIRDKSGRLIPFHPNRVQEEYGWHCTHKNIVLKARQLGMTTYLAARFFIQTITRPGTMSVLVAHDQESAEEIFKIVHRFQENLPEQMRQGPLVTARCNVHQIVFPRLDSEYRVETGADLNAGRGLTIQNLHCSELARWPGDPREALTSLRAGVAPDGEIVLESTPNGAGGCFYEEWFHAGEQGYTQHFFPWWKDEAYVANPAWVRSLTEEEEKLVELYGLSKSQLAFRRQQHSTLRRLAAQEFADDAVSCFLNSGECVFDVSVLQMRMEQCGEPLETQDNRQLMMWWPTQGGKEYIIGVDPAGGGSEGDYSCAEVIERTSAMQCAELRGHFGLQAFANRVAKLAGEYNHAIVAVERNNHGYGVLAHLGSLPVRIYESGGQPGWLTNAVTRPAMIENFAAMLSTGPMLFSSPRLLGECRTFVRLPNGSSGATPGSHDDCVMAMAIALAVRKELAGELRQQSVLELASLR